MKLILLGIQGAGKSTQGNLLRDKLGIQYLSTGHIFREIAKERTPMGRKIKETMTAGYLIPDSQTLEIVSEYLSRPEYQKGYILDGFPRTVKQAEHFKNGIDKVIFLSVSDREALWRLSFRNNDDGREDESLAAIRKRIELYHKFTDPVLDFYKKQKKLIEIDGEKDIDDISREIFEKLGLKTDKKINPESSNKHIIALVGMPGSGKSQASMFFKNKNIPTIRFGDLTDETLKEKGLPSTQENERIVREQLRKDLGMAAYAIAAKPKIEKVSKNNQIVVLDGLYSWEEYTFLKEHFPHMLLVHIFASPNVRYDRLAVRKIRPLNAKEARQRDIFEIENLNKAGSIAMADYLISNENTVKDLHNQLEELLTKIKI